MLAVMKPSAVDGDAAAPGRFRENRGGPLEHFRMAGPQIPMRAGLKIDNRPMPGVACRSLSQVGICIAIQK